MAPNTIPSQTKMQRNLWILLNRKTEFKHNIPLLFECFA
jgi:hypothetical protein